MDIDDILAHARERAEQISSMEGSETHFPALALELAQAFQALDTHMTKGDDPAPQQWL